MIAILLHFLVYTVCVNGALRREEGCLIPASINASDSAIIQTKIIYNKLLDLFHTYVYYIQIRLYYINYRGLISSTQVFFVAVIAHFP